MWIQVLLVAGIITLAIFMMRRTGADSHLAIRRILLALFIIIAVLSVLFPQWVTWVAQLIGVGRGADLVLYGLVLMFLAFVYSQHRRNFALQRQLTRLSRKVALLEADEREKPSSRNQ